ncbi:MAG: hypothetical protein Aurels2KO_45880 [Aureliella sp.]
MANKQPDSDRVIADCTERLAASPGDSETLTKRGWAWLDQENYDNAIGDFDHALVSDANLAGALNGRGLAFSEKGEYDRGIADFSLAINCLHAERKLATLFYNRGRCRHLDGANEQAIEDLSEAIRLAPQYSAAHGVRGLAWAAIDNYKNAMDDYDLAIRYDPDNADALHNRGNVWVTLGKFRRGIADFTRALEIDPGNAATHKSRGIAWRRKGRYAKAIADYERALELDPSSQQPRCALGVLLAACPNRRYLDGARAVRLLTEACEMTNYGEARMIDVLAAAHAENGDFPSAIACQEQALALSTDDDHKDSMRGCLELYKAGITWQLEPPTWRERWA